jgi:ribose 5-phosphate isomerase A
MGEKGGVESADEREKLKQAVGRAGADMVRDGDIVGLGTGSTARYAIERLGERVQEGLHIKGIPTSNESERLARKCKIPQTSLDLVGAIDITIDGADEVDPGLDLIKGLGGALLREKIVASATRNEVIVVDGSKLTGRLGTRAPVPVEVIPYGHAQTARGLARLGCEPGLRRARDSRSPYITDNANYIYDCRFAGREDARALEAQIDVIPGVVESGLFIGLAHVVIAATGNGIELKRRKDGGR